MDGKTVIGGVGLVLGLAGLHWMEFCRDGALTYVAVAVDTSVVLAGIGLLSASTFEKVLISVVNHYVDKYDLILKEKKPDA